MKELGAGFFMTKILTDNECKTIWDKNEKLIVDNPEGKQVMAYLAKKQREEFSGKHTGWVSGIN